MRSRRTAQDQVAELAQRRLQQLSAELADIRPGPGSLPTPPAADGAGEPSGGPDPQPSRAPGRHAHQAVGVPTTMAGWVQDRLPATLQGRVAFSPAHLLVLTGLLVGAAVLTGVWFVRHRGTDAALPPATAADPVPTALVASASRASGAASPGAASPGAAASSRASAPPASTSGVTGSAGAPASGGVVVDVTGKVRRPGIATLPAGARVVDALRAAGGARHGVALGSLNLARVLTDGEQVVVGVPAPPGVAASALATPTGSGGAAAATPMVDINTGTQADLEQLPGIGPVTARAILDLRAQQGSFTSVDQLLDVSGIGDATLAKMAPYVTL